jgi:hypothetical protein
MFCIGITLACAGEQWFLKVATKLQQDAALGN